MCMIWAFTLRSSFYSRHFIGKNAPGPCLASAHHVLSPQNTLPPHSNSCCIEGQCVRVCVCGDAIERRGADGERPSRLQHKKNWQSFFRDFLFFAIKYMLPFGKARLLYRVTI